MAAGEGTDGQKVQGEGEGPKSDLVNVSLRAVMSRLFSRKLCFSGADLSSVKIQDRNKKKT